MGPKSISYSQAKILAETFQSKKSKYYDVY